MLKSRLIFASTCLVTLFSLSRCVSPGGDGTGGAGTTGGGNTTGAAGTTGGGNTTGAAGTTGGGNTAGTSATGAAGTSATGAAGTSATGTAGTSATGAAGTSATGAAGTSATGRGGTTGTAGTSATGAAGRGGTMGAAGTTGAAGTGAAGTSGVRTDQAGVPLGKPGDMTNVSRKYINLGDMRLINNRWGSDELGCSGTQQSVFINADRTLGWTFNRPACGGAKAKPDYPEVEFGVAPFGANNVLLTTPAFSSTTLLPKQISQITSASIVVDQLQISLQRPTIWNLNFEVWLSQRNPLTDANPGVFAEIIAFWGWETGRWPCDKTGNLNNAGTHSYNMCHQSDTWANGQWRFYNFNVNNGPLTNYSGTVNVKMFLDYVVNTYGLSRDLWLTRMEVGSEIDDNTQGTVKIRNLTFEVNGTSKSVELAP
jgi:hypothetical protein